jgi:fluoride exporter
MIERILLVAVGGGIGSVLRFLTALAAARWLGVDFPYGTLIVNLGGAFIIGFVQELATDTVMIPEHHRIFLTTGMMGGLTTYSTFTYETVRLMAAQAWREAALNIIGTTVGCIGLCVVGIATGRALLTAVTR